MWNRLIPALCATMLLTACSVAADTPSGAVVTASNGGDTPAADKVTAFVNTFASREELFDALEAAIESGDVDVMRSLAVSREEFRDLVWPTLPIANRPKSNLTWDFVWQQHQLQHESSLKRIATDFGGQCFEIVGVEARGKTTDHDTFHIHRENYVEVVRPDGDREELRLFGSLLETDDGRFKIYSFIND
ncbi:MAG: hypothetical protein LJE93_12330 [Acidobacteria bacterium]|nr:hypothetical protein [Acidobacteriota bacterium]